MLKSMLPEGPALMSEEEYTDQTERTLAEEIVREKLFLNLEREIPFSTAVVVEAFSEDEEKKLIKIAATIIVDRESHKGIVIGAGGRCSRKSAPPRGSSWKKFSAGRFSSNCW